VSYNTLLRQSETSAVVRLRERLMQPFHISQHLITITTRQESQDTHTETNHRTRSRYQERQFKRQKARHPSHL